MNKNENLKEENQTEIIKEKKRIQIFCLFVCLFVFFLIIIIQMKQINQ